MRQATRTALALLVAVAPLALGAQGVQVPAPPRGYSPTAAEVVVDAAHVLSPEAIARINQISFDVHQKSKGEIAVVTLPDLGGRSVEETGLAILRGWGMGAQGGAGDAARNAGVLILVVPKETSADGSGHFRIEVGRGAEGFITDGTSGAIQDEAIPLLRQRDYSGAMALTTYRVAERFAGEFGFALDTAIAPPAPQYAPQSYPRQGPRIPIGTIIFVVFLLLSLMSRRRGRGGCMPIFLPMGGGGFGGGGFGGGGFGGGGFGGGGFGGFGGGGGGGGGGSSRSW